MKLSETMKEALARVPDDWGYPATGFRLGRKWVRHALFQPTFRALKRHGVIEWRGGPGTWEWRKVPAQKLRALKPCPAPEER